MEFVQEQLGQNCSSCEQTCEIPVIFITALDEVLDEVKAFAVAVYTILISLLKWKRS